MGHRYYTKLIPTLLLCGNKENSTLLKFLLKSEKAHSGQVMAQCYLLNSLCFYSYAFSRHIYFFFSESSFAKILVLTPNKQDISWKVWDAGAFMLDYYSAARRWTAWTCKWYQDRPISGKSRGLEGEKDHSRVSASYVYSGIMFSSMAQNMEITDRQIPGSYASME